MAPHLVCRTALLALAGGTLPAAHAATYVVNAASDIPVASCAPGGTCTLRAAIEAANARSGLDRIEFDLPVPSVIAPSSSLPAVLDQTIIDARPDPGYGGRPQVFLDGLAANPAYGLVVAGEAANGSQVFGLGFANWEAAGLLLLEADAVLVDGCEFGFNNIGSLRGNGHGIHVDADFATIGQYFLSGIEGPVGEGNTIVGSTGAGILVTGNDNRLRGNALGTANSASGNGGGIHVTGNGNQIGGGPGDGSSDPVGNRIWFSSGDAIRIQGNDNRVLANQVGTGASGESRPNGGNGIVVAGTGNQIGGDGGFDRNRVAHNGTGILLGLPSAASGTEVLRNDVHANRGTGIRIQAGSGNLLDRNRSFGNGTAGVGDGIRVDGDDNVLSRNRVGMEGGNSGEGIYVNSAASGTFIGPDNVIGNNRAGVKVEGPDTAVTSNTIGGATTGNAFDGIWLTLGADRSLVDLNRIDGNASHGVRVDSDDNELRGNRIGLEAGNANAGVLLTGSASGNLLQDNVIGNNLDGVLVQGAGNRLLDNRIGVLDDGGDAGNGRHGLRAAAGATGLLAEGNRIEGNNANGVFVEADSVRLCGNQIGGEADPSGALAGRGNGANGIEVSGATGARIGEGCSSGNLVLFSGGEGVRLHNATGAVVAYNRLASSTFAGVLLTQGSAGNQVQYNTIDGNSLEGVLVSSSAGEGNELRGNQMSGNGLPGIDLNHDGPSANDAGDADEGPNRLQNTPVLLFNAAAGELGLEVGYSVDSAAGNAAYPLRVEVFAGDGASATVASREGASALGSGSYAGPGVASVTVARPPPATRWLLATATDADGNTSEFSAAVLWSDAAPAGTAIFRSGFESEAPPSTAGLRASPR